ncbi:hypothetical protein D9756_008336 [Leucocoprinus leucothites]|uniref:F-box domain-containing protein n=1 Tax=Leucocoprinus leucothites TaxID=201217 RepID=A0A8H5D0V2_9AGAR|nr:hypothetical protein D9756_008336 [Leucoagaricus leucothites]
MSSRDPKNCPQLGDNSSAPASMATLPTELISEILYRLNSRGLRAVKLTCKAFYNATRSHQFWQRLFQTLISTSIDSHAHDLLLLKETSLEKLERCTMQRLRVQLLPGGRWLVLSTYEGRYFIFDLNSAGSRPRLLFDPSKPHDEQDIFFWDELAMFTVWVNPDSENMSFRVLAWSPQGPAEPGHITRSMIFEVDLIEGPPGGSFEISVKQLRCWRHPVYERYTRCAALSHAFLAEIHHTSGGTVETCKEELFLCKYTSDSNPGRLLETGVLVDISETEVLRTPECRIFLTPQGQIVVVSKRFIDIYTIPQISQCRTNAKATPLHHIELPFEYGNIAPPFIYRGFHWMVLRIRDEYRLVKFPQDIEDTPRLEILGFHYLDRENPLCMDIMQGAAAASFHDDAKMDLVVYCWDIEMARCAIRIKPAVIPELPPCSNKLIWWGLDIVSGKVVIVDRTNG